MDILVVLGSPLRVNSSANLCNAAYINGFIENGHNVDLVTMSEEYFNIDEGISFPKVKNLFEFGTSKYTKFSLNKQTKTTENKQTANVNDKSKKVNHGVLLSLKKLKSRFIFRLKAFIRNRLYGEVYSITNIWRFKVIHNYKNEQKYYDLVVSLSDPQIGHKVADLLIKKKKVKCGKWIQIWEDPWILDESSGINRDSKRTIREEAYLLKRSDRVLYVSPLTLIYQERFFGNYNGNMKWLPLPIYYNSEEKKQNYDNNLAFGYFGDYDLKIRDLRPFYNAAVKNNLEAYICGNSYLNLKSQNNVTVEPRLPLNELKEYEDKANVLIFLCNSHGGQIPGKIYQYSGTNKLILFIMDGTEEEKQTVKEYFAKFDRYVFCDNNEESIMNAIKGIKEYAASPSYTKKLDIFSARNITRCIVNDTDDLINLSEVAD